MKKSFTLIDFQTYLSESLFSRIKTLEKIIGDRHWLTTGTFKEKVLLDFLNKHLPRKLKAKSGFVIFPCTRTFDNDTNPSNYEYLNSASYEISKQIDIIIYNNNDCITIYEDENLIILPPESVLAIIEVKGTLSNQHLNKSISQLDDYALKWLDFKRFAEENLSDIKLTPPQLIIFSWEKQKYKNGKISYNEKQIRNSLKNHVLKKYNDQSIENDPHINSVYIFNESITSFCCICEDDGLYLGYLTSRGKISYVNDDNSIEYPGDHTLFSLLREILTSCNLLGNRFIIDADQTSLIGDNEHFGYCKLFKIS